VSICISSINNWSIFNISIICINNWSIFNILISINICISINI